MPKLCAVTEGMLRPAASTGGGGGRRQLGGCSVIFAYDLMRQSADVLSGGGRIGFGSGRLERLFDECAILRPTAFGATPTLWNGLYKEFRVEVAKGLAQQRCERRDGAKAIADGDGKRDEFEVSQEVLLEWRSRSMLGNRLQVLVSTGAPIRHEVSRCGSR